MQKEAVSAEHVSAPKGPYSHAIRAGGLVFLAGQVARDREGRTVGKGDIRTQAEQVMKNIKALLEASGVSLDNVVKMTVYLTRIEDLAIVGEVRRRYFGEPYPASTTVQVSALAESELLVEIAAIAVVG